MINTMAVNNNFILSFREYIKVIPQVNIEVKTFRTTVKALGADFKKFGAQARNSLNAVVTSIISFGKNLASLGSSGNKIFDSFKEKASKFIMLGGKIWQMGRNVFEAVKGVMKLKNSLSDLFATLRKSGGLAKFFSGKEGLLGNIGQFLTRAGGKLAGKGGVLGRLGGLLGGGEAMAVGEAGAVGGAATGGVAASIGTALPVIGGVIAALALFRTAWKHNFSGLREAAGKALEPLGNIACELLKLKKGTDPIKAIGMLIKKIWLGIAKVVAPVFKLIFTIIGAIFRIVHAVLAPVFQLLGELFKKMGIAGKVAGDGISGIFSGIAKVVGWIADAIGWVVDRIADWITKIIGFFVNLYKQAIKGNTFIGKMIRIIAYPITFIVFWIKLIIKFVKKLINWFKKTDKEGVSRWEKLRRTIRFVAGFIKLIWQKTIEKIKKLFENIGKFISRVWTNIVKKIKKVLKKIGGFISRIWTKLKIGVKKAAKFFKEKLVKPIAQAFEWLKKNVFAPIGHFFSKLFSPLIDAFNKVFGWIKKQIAKFFSGKGISKIARFFGIKKEELQALRDWAKQPPAGGTKEMPPEDIGAKDKDKNKDKKKNLDDSGTNNSSCSGITIQNTYNHFHFTADAIKIFTSNLDAETFVTMLKHYLTVEQGATL